MGAGPPAMVYVVAGAIGAVIAGSVALVGIVAIHYVRRSRL